MKTNQQLYLSNNLKAYDESYQSKHTMYDSMPYVCDPELCNRGNVALRSDNLIKHYRCSVKDKRVITT